MTTVSDRVANFAANGMPTRQQLDEQRRQEQERQAQQGQERAQSSALVPLADGTMAFRGCKLTPIHLTLPNEVTEEEYREIGRTLFNIEGALQWWLGDYIVYGETIWKYTYDSIANTHGKQIETLYVYASVARSVKPLIRNQDLSFSHHRLVQGLKPDQQKAWLDRAAKNGWKIDQMRAAMRAELTSGKTDEASVYDHIFAKDRVPKLNAKALRNLVIRAKAGDEKAYAKLGDIVHTTRELMDEIVNLFAK